MKPKEFQGFFVGDIAKHCPRCKTMFADVRVDPKGKMTWQCGSCQEVVIGQADAMIVTYPGGPFKKTGVFERTDL